MAIQMSVALRNARLDAIEGTIALSAVLKLRTGAPPETVATADSGTVVSTIQLPEDWMNAADAGAKTLKGTWADASADADGTIAHFRVYEDDGTTCHIQGTVTSTAVGTGDMLIDNPVVVETQAISITSFTLTDANA